MIEYSCEGCGSDVYAYGLDAVPPHGFCVVCAWLCEHVPDPEEMEMHRRGMDLVVANRVSARYHRAKP